MGVGIDQKQRNVESPKSQLSFFCSLVLSYSRKWGWGDGDGRDYAFETTLPIKNNPPLDPLENCFRPAPALVSMMKDSAFEKRFIIG